MACVVLAAFVGESFAQSTGVRREVSIPAAAGTFEQLVMVPAPVARCAAVSDVTGILAIAHKQGLLPHISLFALDDKGAVKETPLATITLPMPDALSKRQNYPLAVAAHPKLPLLYVWQDIGGPVEGQPADNLKEDGFCHLLIYDISSAEPQLVQSTAKGEDYQRGNTAGTIGFDLTAERLFVPNLRRQADKGATTPGIGYLRLDEKGLVLPDDEDEATLQVTGNAGKATGKDDASLKLAARKAYLADAKAGKLPNRYTRAATSVSATFAGYPCGLSFFPISDAVTIVGGPLGPVTWDDGNRLAKFTSIALHPLVGAGYLLRLVGHPKLPVIFVTGLNSGSLFRMEHVDGFMAGLPQHGTLAGVTGLSTPPVMLGDRSQFACGSPNLVHLIKFDEQGQLTGERIDVPVPSAVVAALVYSPKFDRLYVGVEPKKK